MIDNKLHENSNIEEHDLVASLLGLQGSDLAPQNKLFQTNLWKRLENASTVQKAAVQKRRPTKTKKSGFGVFLDFSWSFYKFQTAGLMALVVLIACTTTGVAAYLGVPQVRQNVQLLVNPNATGTLALQSEPVGAAVYLDGQLLGQTPYIGAVRVGRHNLVLKVDGYQDVAQEISLNANQRLDLNYTLEAFVIDIYQDFKSLELSSFGISLRYPGDWEIETFDDDILQFQNFSPSLIRGNFRGNNSISQVDINIGSEVVKGKSATYTIPLAIVDIPDNQIQLIPGSSNLKFQLAIYDYSSAPFTGITREFRLNNNSDENALRTFFEDYIKLHPQANFFYEMDLRQTKRDITVSGSTRFPSPASAALVSDVGAKEAGELLQAIKTICSLNYNNQSDTGIVKATEPASFSIK